MNENDFYVSFRLFDKYLTSSKFLEVKCNFRACFMTLS